MNTQKRPLFRGAATAMVTPFSDGGIDFDALGRMVDFQLASGISALVVCGTTGESPTLSTDEQTEITAFVAEKTNGRVPVIAGAGSNSTSSTVAAVRRAARAGADAVMVVTPYYNKPSPDGLIAHYCAAADASDVPVIAYNVPSRTGVSLSHEVCRALARHDNIIAVKEASGNLSLAEFCLSELNGALSVYSGCDELTLPFLSLGADGVISVVSNIMPKKVAELCRSYHSGDTETAVRIFHKLRPITEALFRVSNPIPVKAACAELGLCKNELRLPLTPLSEKGSAELYKLIKNCVC